MSTPIVFNQSLISQLKRALNELEPTISLNNTQYLPQVLNARQQLISCEEFLNKLKHHPEILIFNLKTRVTQDFANYLKKNISRLSVAERVCLWTYELNLSPLFKIYSAKNFASTKRLQQINYLLLCSFLRYLFQTILKEDPHSKLRHILESAIESTHIPAQDSLPDNMAIDYNASNFYPKILSFKNPLIIEISAPQIEEFESKLLLKELHKLKKLKHGSQLQVHIHDAINLISDELIEKKKKNIPINYYLYLKIVQNLNFIYRDPCNQTACNNLIDLVNCTSQILPLGKKVFGSLSLILGLMIISISLIGLAVSLGSSSFASSLGLFLGLNLISSQILLATSFSFTTIVGAKLSFWGASLYKEGTKLDLSQTLLYVHNEAKTLSLLEENSRAAHRQ